MTSYQRQKRRIAFHEQRERDLEQLIDALCRQVKAAGGEVRIPLIGGGITGDQIITDVSSGEFLMALQAKHS